MTRSPRGILPLGLLLVLVACSSDDDPTAPTTGSPGGQPAAVTDLAVTAATDGSVSLSWTTPGVPGQDGALERYDLRRAPLGNEPAEREDWIAVDLPPPAAPGTAAAATVDGLAAGSTWVFRLRSRSADRWSVDSPAIVATANPQWDQTAPAAVADLTLRWRSDEELLVTWSPVGDDAGYGEATAYELRHAAAPLDEASWDAASPGPAPVFAAQLGSWTCQVTGLDAEQTVHLAVRASDDVDHWSGLSNGVEAAPPEGNVWHVKPDGSGTVPTIAEGIRQAGYRDLILLHPGRYTWTNQGGPMHELGMIFVGRDTTDFTLASALGPESTIIDAEGQGCVIFIQGYNDGVVIEGLTITGGANPATGDDEYPLAGGLTYHLTSPTVRNCIFEGNSGGQGGAIGFFGVGTPTIEGCIIRDNHAEIYGGGIYAINVHGPGSDPDSGIEIIDCVIENNTSGFAGGGICLLNAVALIEGCVIAGNSSETSGGGITIAGRAIADAADSWVTVERSTLAGNASPLGAAVRVTNTMSLDGTELRHGHGRITSSIVAGHLQEEWLSQREETALEIGCCALHGNLGEMSLPPSAADLGGNLWLDPLFCGEGAMDPWTVDAASVCLPGAHPDGADCGSIGARGAGCGG